MKRIHQHIVIIIVLILFKSSISFAQDIFTLKVVEQSSSKVVIRCDIHADYQPNNYCKATYVWNFGVYGSETVEKYEDETYTGITYEFSLSGGYTEIYEIISLQILEYEWVDFTGGDPQCLYKSDSYEEEILDLTLGTSLSVDVNTDPEDGYQINNSINFYAFISPNSPDNTDNLLYVIQKTSGPEIPGEEASIGYINEEDFNTTLNLNYNITPVEQGSYEIVFTIVRGGDIVYMETIILIVTEDGGDGGDDGGDGDTDCHGNCGPYGTYYLDYYYLYVPADKKYLLIFNPAYYYPPDGAECNIGINWVKKVDLGTRASGEDDFNWVEILNHENVNDDEFRSISFYGASLNKFRHNVPMDYSDEPKDVIIKIKVFDFFTDEICWNAPNSGLYTFSETITLPTPEIDPNTINQLELEPVGHSDIEIPTFAEGCYAVEIVDPNNPIAEEEDTWITIDEDKSNENTINFSHQSNVTEDTREIELRIYDDDISHPSLLIDKNGNRNYYRSVWFTQPSLLSDIDYDEMTLIPLPIEKPKDAAYYGLFGTEPNENDYYVLQNPSYFFPLEMLIEKKGNSGWFDIWDYDEYGNSIGRHSKSFYNSSCNPLLDMTEFLQKDVDFYIGNTSTASLSYNFTVPAEKGLILFAPEEIKFIPGFHAEYGSTFDAKIKDCITTQSMSFKSMINPEEEKIQLSTNQVSDFDILIYPNPTIHSFIVEINRELEDISSIDIYTITGQLIESKKSGFEQINKFNTSGWQYGVYLVKITTADGPIVKRLLKVQLEL